MSVALARGRTPRRLRRLVSDAGAVVLAVVLLIWWLLPVYNMMLIALDPEGDTEFTGDIWPSAPTLEAFRGVLFQRYWYLQDFWRQLGNSFFIGIMTMALTVLIGSLASFALGRMRLGKGGVISTAALLLYMVPAYFLVIPFYLLMHRYGLIDSLWAVIAADVTFAVPYAVLILQWYGRLIPLELDEAARIDGATPGQVYVQIYLPLMAPALAAVGTYALLTAWNEYLYQFILLSSPRNKTVAITLATFFDNEDTPWNYPVAASLIYALPPIALFFAVRRYIAAGLTLGGVKG
ncbi:MAG: ABC transporter permease [Candidatus Rokuibacteriota bacterium]|nr:MAG: ABC transporter permease [Candidatus Rokubacteria bacterium]